MGNYFSPRQWHKLEQRKKAFGDDFLNKPQAVETDLASVEKSQDNNEPPPPYSRIKTGKKTRIFIDEGAKKVPEIEKYFYSMYKTEVGFHLLQQKNFDVATK